MEYKYLTQESQDESLATAVREREREHHNYELNKINYQHILDSMSDLPDEWPDRFKQYQNLLGENLANAVQGEDYEQIIRYQFRDRVRLLLATTIAEQIKSESVYRALQSQISDEACLAALVRVDARKVLDAGSQ